MSTKSKDPKKNAENLKILEGLLANPENRVCADCASRGPRWCSTTWGVFICIRCSGFHRSMGTHITRVKSVSQDFFTDDEVNTLRANGNAIANDSLEARLRPSDKPRMDSSDEFVQSFLRAKYEHLRFAPAGWIPPHKRAEQIASRPPGRSTPAEFGSPSASPPSGYGARQPVHHQPHAHRTPTIVPPPSSTAASPVHHQPAPTPTASPAPLVSTIAPPGPPTPQPQITFPEDPSIKAKNDIMSLFDSTPSAPSTMQPGGGVGMLAPAGGMAYPGMMPQQMMMPGFVGMPGQSPMMAQPMMMPGFVGMPGAPGGFGMTGPAPPTAGAGGFGMTAPPPAGGFGMPAPGGFGMPGGMPAGGFGMPAPGGFGMPAPGGFGMPAPAPGGFGMPAGYPAAVAPTLQTATPQPPKKQEPDPFASLVSFS